MPIELQAARLRLVKERPYLASALWALRPAAKPGLGTLAVDRWWRVYFDPAVSSRWSVEELAGVLYHEVAHLLRDHAARMEGLDPRLANLAADAEVNDDLLREGVRLPGAPVTPKALGLPEGLLAEEYYAALGTAGSASGPSRAGGPSAPASGSASGSSGEGGPSGPASGPASGPSGKGDPSGSTRGPASGSSGGKDSSGSPSGDVSGEPEDSSARSDAGSGRLGGSSARPDAGPGRLGGSSARSDAGPGRPDAGSAVPGGGEEGRGVRPAPGGGRCGSCATGTPEDWEYPPPSEGGPDGVARAEAELIRRDVARAIREASQARGDVPGHWKRWAEEKLRPKADWRRELASAVRRAAADVAGAADYTYRRPSRRQGQAGNGRVILPALRRPVPKAAVVVDTSASVSDRMLSQALAEVAGVLKACGLREAVHVLAVDAAVRSCRRVFRPEQVDLLGGGGTDMAAGFRAAERLRPRPDVAVVLTDGHTPWPEGPPRGMKVVVGLLGDGRAPEWARAVRIEAE